MVVAVGKVVAVDRAVAVDKVVAPAAAAVKVLPQQQVAQPQVAARQPQQQVAQAVDAARQQCLLLQRLLESG